LIIANFATPFSQILPDFDEAVDLPNEIHDPDFFGLEVDTKLRCYHGEVPARKVAFIMAVTGRSFFGCNHEVSVKRLI
jgi:hypothetical protein